jgi:hypothetical protein
MNPLSTLDFNPGSIKICVFSVHFSIIEYGDITELGILLKLNNPIK